ncbi:MAG: glycosyltransferase family 2 protein [Psychroserpens sp.]|uniref:glycosyltransferase family 2 protein n=1 Tax=Psychroserpens sp. TaxID=2020870 RepID=UPI0030031FE9
MMPLVSIIIPTYNRDGVVQKAIESIITQSYSNWECIVIDDGSDDQTDISLDAYCKKDKRILFFNRNRLPKGAPTCRNIGLKHVKGDYVIFLDSDDYLLPFCLEQRVKNINKYHEFDFLVFPMGIKKNNTIWKQEIPQYEDYLIPFLSANLLWQTMCPIWKVEFIKQLEGFTEGYPRFNDPELMIRAFLNVKSGNYLVCGEMDYDSVHIREEKHEKIFKNKVFESLKLFIPDISKALNENNKIEHKKHLSNYLHLWFKYFYIPLSDRRNLSQSLYLIMLFFKHGILSLKKTTSLAVRFLLYVFSYYCFKKPIDKLTSKAFYIY